MGVVHDHLLHNIIDRHQIFTKWETEGMKSQEGERIDAWVGKKSKAQLAENLPSMCKVLGSMPRPRKKNLVSKLSHCYPSISPQASSFTSFFLPLPHINVKKLVCLGEAQGFLLAH